MARAFQTMPGSGNAESFHPETVELLRSEIAQLEQELAERDARLAELTARASIDDSQEKLSTEPATDTVALVSRLEQLLDELDRRDQREASLQEMLRAAEEANRAEQEERHQIESWLNEIEQRIGAREAEWQAANDELRIRIQTVTEERDRAEEAAAAGTGGMDSHESQNIHSNLRHHITELERKLSEKEKQVAMIKGRLAEAEAAASAASAKEATDKILREERLQMAHERAELARQRAELEHERRGLARGPSEVDQRVKALREHLREIHERQAIEDKQRQQHGLVGRLTQLWKRLDG